MDIVWSVHACSSLVPEAHDGLDQFELALDTLVLALHIGFEPGTHTHTSYHTHMHMHMHTYTASLPN